MGASNFLRKLIGGGGRSGIDRRTEDLISLCSALLAESGEYTSTALARDALAAYQALDERTRAEFFDVLARDYGVPVQLVSRAAASYQADPSVENLLRLQQAVDSPRQEFFRRLNMAPGGTAALSKEVVGFVQRLRKMELFKLPGVAETIDWANCLAALDRVALDPETVNNTLGVLLKYRDDLERVAGEEAERLVAEARAAAAA